MALLSWICAIKKIFVVLELGKLGTIYTVLESTKLEYLFLKNKNKKIYTVLEFGKLEYCVNGTRVYQARVPQKFF